MLKKKNSRKSPPPLAHINSINKDFLQHLEPCAEYSLKKRYRFGSYLATSNNPKNVKNVKILYVNPRHLTRKELHMFRDTTIWPRFARFAMRLMVVSIRVFSDLYSTPAIASQVCTVRHLSGCAFPMIARITHSAGRLCRLNIG